MKTRNFLSAAAMFLFATFFMASCNKNDYEWMQDTPVSKGTSKSNAEMQPTIQKLQTAGGFDYRILSRKPFVFELSKTSARGSMEWSVKYQMPDELGIDLSKIVADAYGNAVMVANLRQADQAKSIGLFIARINSKGDLDFSTAARSKESGEIKDAIVDAEQGVFICGVEIPEDGNPNLNLIAVNSKGDIDYAVNYARLSSTVQSSTLTDFGEKVVVSTIAEKERVRVTLSKESGDILDFQDGNTRKDSGSELGNTLQYSSSKLNLTLLDKRVFNIHGIDGAANDPDNL